MYITVNGEPRHMPSSSTIDQLVDMLGLVRSQIAIEHNLTIVPRSQYAATELNEGDAIEIVRFIGGG